MIRKFCSKCVDFHRYKVTLTLYLTENQYARQITCRECGWNWFEIDDQRPEIIVEAEPSKQ